MKIHLPPHDMADDGDLIENFFDAMWAFYDGQVLELRKELPDIQCPEIEIYCAFRYEGEVKNGGHNQYINNLDGNQEEFAIALSGLRLIGADKQADILRRMIHWTKAEPNEVHRMLNTYTHVKQPALELLTNEFFGVQKEVTVRHLAAIWLRTNGDIEIVTKEQYHASNQTLRKPQPRSPSAKASPNKNKGETGLRARLLAFFGKPN
ncbi:DMP19 family protein [Rhizobium rhizogenes]|uniref:DMP19 family protein n=1 Tax=Rhizobium rhizogenes TaxID=359 RepID=UPI0015743BD2|nr:DUF4375 domain-containing protein [Rhizobium rhizogenes]NTF64959.1 DMP19 family protein [Rhizobium rhizogenes]NTG96307.1 DMP19 family protein [Rhizobium rhizogenes]